MAKHALPVSKAKTAYGLLSEIRKLILEEPKRYDQESVRYTPKNPDLAPSCGTTACVAGWVVVLKSPRTTQERVLSKAANILGFEWRNFHATAIDELFAGDAVGTRYSFDLQTHAQDGADHISAFQKKYAKQLKAKKL